jgi:hypothetical protein
MHRFQNFPKSKRGLSLIGGCRKQWPLVKAWEAEEPSLL